MRTLVLEVASGAELIRVPFTATGDEVRVPTGDDEPEVLRVQDVPVVITEVIDLQPTGEVDRDFSLSAEELDGLVADGLVRMIVLRREDADEAEGVIFAHEDLGYVVVQERDADRFEAVTITALDVWTVICGIVEEVLAP